MVSKLDEFKNSKEYKLWGNIKEVCDNLNLRSENDVLKLEEMNEYWEPLLERIFKLGVSLKQTGKLKEIKIDWIRPGFYVKTELEFVMDGKKYEPEKGPVQAAQKVKRELQYLIAFIQENYDRVDLANFKSIKTDFTKKSSEFFKALIAFATKDNNYRFLKANIKEILRPLVDLRKANFKLFLLEAKEYGDAEITLFNHPKEMKEFQARVVDHFQAEEFKLKRDVDLKLLEDYMYKNMSTANFIYEYSNKKRENYTNDAAFRFRKEALQAKFEEAFEKMLKYLYDKKKTEFYMTADVHKMFRNLDILGKDESLPIKFYLDQEKTFLREMKVKLYEMKLNGLTRCKMPITRNEELINIIKKLYDMHNTVDYLMGNRLKYDQFVFFFNCLKFIHESTLKEEMTVIKNKSFMEDAIGNYIILSAIRQAAIILEKMRVKSKSQGKKFDWGDYYQVENKPLDSEYGLVFDCFEMNETVRKVYTSSSELKTNKEILDNEIGEFGARFWILEGFFPSEDRKLWLEAIEMLRNINSLVIDDIRDYLLTNYEKDVKASNFNTRTFEKKSTKKLESLEYKKRESKINLSHVKTSQSKSKNRSSSKTKKVTLENKLMNDTSFDSEDESTLKMKAPIKLEHLRPPFVWNFPVELCQDSKNADKKNEVRNVDPTKFYSDNRVKLFLDLLYKIKTNTFNFCLDTKNDMWRFFYEKALAIWNINYAFERKLDKTENTFGESNGLNNF